MRLRVRREGKTSSNSNNKQDDEFAFLFLLNCGISHLLPTPTLSPVVSCLRLASCRTHLGHLEPLLV
ncbi:hypothetical protein E2C01_023095 [Portunus trituberculatus]|uniref:Uncharacterized protein n=1 Tax=Portunus trituberculatus TaxID=210409 RepID=A0A5B7EAM8_PORTR|nr:hypothetical protein [Portunus trituberculatus]